ncbi:MAG: glycosyltransferase family 2 protein [Pseudomonadota bacterium]
MLRTATQLNYASIPRLTTPTNALGSVNTQICCTIVIVCFHSLAELPDCLEVLSGGSPAAGLEVIVVNNSQSDAKELALHCASQNVGYIQSRTNIGYGAACNLGAAQAQGRYVLFMNPDVRISRASLQAMVDLTDKNRDLVAIGPLQGDVRGKVRGKRRSVGQIWRPGKKTLRRLSDMGRLEPTGFLGGGVLMVRKDAFDGIGGFDENVFLFHEDDDLCLRLAKQGHLAYAAGVLAVHDAGKSSPTSAALTKTKAWHLGNSKVYVACKHYGRWAGLGPLVEAVLKFANPAMLTRRGRMKACAFLAGVWSGQVEVMSQAAMSQAKVNR